MISSNDVSAANPSRSARRRVQRRRPAADHPHDRRVRLAADQPHRLLAGHPAQRLDLLADRGATARASTACAAARSAPCRWSPRAGRTPPPSGARRASAARSRAPAAPPPGRPAARAGCSRRSPDAALFGRARPDADGGQPDADAVDEAAPGVVGQQQLADRLLGAVAGERQRRRSPPGSGSGSGAPKTAIEEANTSRGRYPSAARADRLQQRAGAVEVDPVALVEVGLGLAGDHRGEVEDHVRPAVHQPLGRAGRGEVRARAGLGRPARRRRPVPRRPPA